MSEKAHNVTSLNDPAPEAPEIVETKVAWYKKPFTNISPNAKLFGVGVLAGAATAYATLKYAKSKVEDEEETAETPLD